MYTCSGHAEFVTTYTLSGGDCEPIVMFFAVWVELCSRFRPAVPALTLGFVMKDASSGNPSHGRNIFTFT